MCVNNRAQCIGRKKEKQTNFTIVNESRFYGFFASFLFFSFVGGLQALSCVFSDSYGNNSRRKQTNNTKVKPGLSACTSVCIHGTNHIPPPHPRLVPQSKPLLYQSNRSVIDTSHAPRPPSPPPPSLLPFPITAWTSAGTRACSSRTWSPSPSPETPPSNSRRTGSPACCSGSASPCS